MWNFAGRDLRARFKGTALGWAWSLVVPLATLLIYSIVFSVIFRAEPPPLGSRVDLPVDTAGRGNFTLFLFSGLVVWGFFANGLNTAVGTLLSVGPLLKKIYFPPWAPVLGSLLAVGSQVLIEMGLLLAALALFGNVGWTWLLAPLWAVLFGAFVAGVSVTLATFNVFFRDVAHVIQVALQLMFYATPILYPVAFIPERHLGLPLRAIIEWQPLSQFVLVFRDLTYGLTPGAWQSWLYMVALAAVSVATAAAVTAARGRDLSEEL